MIEHTVQQTSGCRDYLHDTLHLIRFWCDIQNACFTSLMEKDCLVPAPVTCLSLNTCNWEIPQGAVLLSFLRALGLMSNHTEQARNARGKL